MSTSNIEKDGAAHGTFRIPRDSAWARSWQVSLVIGGLGAVGCVLGYEPRRFAFAWLFAFMTTLAVALGSLFFVLIQHLTGAGWSVTLRRTSEFFIAPLAVFALLFLPLLPHLNELYPWTNHAEHGEEAHGASHEGGHAANHSSAAVGVAHAQSGAAVHAENHDDPAHAIHAQIIAAKSPYLNTTRFGIFAVVYFGLWALLGFYYFRKSTSQDQTKAISATQMMEKWAPLATIGFGLSLTFAAFDWMMSLEPAWFSTIFGVQYFAVSFVAGLAVLILTTLSLHSAGYLGKAVHVEHFHDAGKLMFGFLVFWAYITFSQFMLIWYASIPEETTYYHIRWSGGWRTVSVLFVVAHFTIPFFILMSRNTKRSLAFLKFGAAWLLVMHVLEVYWLVMPYRAEGSLEVHWVDVAALFAVAGTYFAAVLFTMTRHPLIPVGDPRLSRALHHEVV